jgi:hypothetical protein
MQQKSEARPWTSAADLRGQIQKLWDRGELLSCIVTGESLFPKRLMLRGPSSTELIDRFDEVRPWINTLRQMPHCRVKMRHFKHRLLGGNDVPDEVWVDSSDDAFAMIDKKRDVARFLKLVEMTRRRQPELLCSIAKRSLRVLDLFDDWERLLDVVEWVKDHPRPGVYLRQVDIPGVHTKFLENHVGLLSDLLDIVLSPETIDLAASGVSQFARRYGFIEKPLRVRIKILDPVYALLPDGLAQDMTLDAESFARLDPKVSRVFITENEINFLSFPQVKDSLLIFGAGYGFEMLVSARWLCRCDIYYWGDIDTHGFAILDQLRSVCGDVRSFLMDRTTFMEHRCVWGQEDNPTARDLARLNEEELALYDDLRDNRIGKNLRLEQERIGFSRLQSCVRLLDREPA